MLTTYFKTLFDGETFIPRGELTKMENAFDWETMHASFLNVGAIPAREEHKKRGNLLNPLAGEIFANLVLTITHCPDELLSLKHD
jgi:hypothetical protein